VIAVRMAIYGARSLVMHGDRLKAGIDIVGIANFTTFLKNTSRIARICAARNTATNAIR